MSRKRSSLTSDTGHYAIMLLCRSRYNGVNAERKIMPSSIQPRWSRSLGGLIFIVICSSRLDPRCVGTRHNSGESSMRHSRPEDFSWKDFSEIQEPFRGTDPIHSDPT